MKTTKVTRKIVSLLLALSMMISGFIVPQPLIKAKEEQKSTVAANTKVQSEKITQKTENATIYEDGSGKKRAEIYAQDIRFKDEKGKLTDYDISLKEVTDKESETGENLSKYEYQNGIKLSAGRCQYENVCTTGNVRLGSIGDHV